MGLFWARRKEHKNDQNRQEKSISKRVINQNVEIITYGNAVFELSEDDYNKIEEINQKSFQIFLQPDWSLEYREFQKGNWSEVFKIMVESSVQILALFNSGSSSIIKQIEHITFTNLEILSLGRNKIQSIEGLGFLNIDTLKSLRLNENMITSIQPLTKLKCRNLQILLLSDNKIIDFDDLNRIKFNSDKSGYEFKSKLSIDLRLSEKSKNYAKQMGVDIGYLMKVQLKSISQLRRDNEQIRPIHWDQFMRRNNSAINLI